VDDPRGEALTRLGGMDTGDFDCIIFRDLAARGYLGIDTAIPVAVGAQPRLRHIEVADAGLRIDVGRRPAHNALDHFNP
jgi:hypothetical protein